MASNSIRNKAGLFEAARKEGLLISKSAAWQIEHWAKIGASLEPCCLTVAQVASLPDRLAGRGDANLWKFKRAQQKADIKGGGGEQTAQNRLSSLSGGTARRSKVIDAPY
ncbi:TA system antitoxin ParD family protein [Roseateles sp. NT4]|uniref:TA system antitoxin ParD family protein n=1 Tax=Roseateles sp. NT4 TaxID=3453715 RepID=UPI003EEC8A47